MKLLKIIREFWFRGRKVFFFPVTVLQGDYYGGIVLKLEKYTVIYKYPFLIKEIISYWKPLKKYVSREALPHVLEYGDNASNPYVSIWFKIKNSNDYSIFNIVLIEKLKWKSEFLDVLDNLSTNVQK